MGKVPRLSSPKLDMSCWSIFVLPIPRIGVAGSPLRFLLETGRCQKNFPTSLGLGRVLRASWTGPWLHLQDLRIDFARLFGEFRCSEFKKCSPHQCFLFRSWQGLNCLQCINRVCFFFSGKRQVGNVIVDLWSTYWKHHVFFWFEP